jgi:hypothetical protein
MGKERPKHVELPKLKKTKQSDVKLVAYRYCNTMHGTMNLKFFREVGKFLPYYTASRA